MLIRASLLSVHLISTEPKHLCFKAYFPSPIPNLFGGSAARLYSYRGSRFVLGGGVGYIKASATPMASPHKLRTEMLSRFSAFAKPQSKHVKRVSSIPSVHAPTGFSDQQV